MDAGRHGGCTDYEFRDRDSDFEATRQEFANYEDYELSSEGGREIARGRDRAKVRLKDIKEREVVKGGYRSSSSSSDSGGSSDGGIHGLRQQKLSHRVVDKEPGELSSDSGSEDAIESDSVVKDSEVAKVMGNGAPSHVGRKRKFSPIVWDRSDKDLSMSKSGNSPAVTVVRHPPPHPKAYPRSPNDISGGTVHLSGVIESKSEKSHSPSPVAADEAVGYSALLSPEHLEFSPPKEHVNYQDAWHLEDEDYVPARHLSSSRWAAGGSSPGDEGEILEDEEMPKKRKKLPLLELSHNRLRNRSATPELAELKMEGSEGIRARSSESDERHYKPGIGDDYPGNDSEKDDFMEVDIKRDRNDSSLSQSDADSENENNSHGTPPEHPTLPLRSVNMLQGCRCVDEFERLNKIDEGTYGVVFRAKDKKTGEIVALKKVKMEKEREGFPLTSLREINILLSSHHPSIVDVKEVVVGSSLDSIFMVMEYMEHDLKALMETMKQPFSQSEVKCLMLQLLEGVKYLHDNWVLHRDLKTSNLLLNNQGDLKICDFGLARQYGSPLKPYTHLVVTLWYRAPELLLGARQYFTAIDMWSLGCIMAELLSKEPLFNGKTEFDQLYKIFRTLGTPNETIWPGFSKLPGVKVNFVNHQLPALGITYCARNFHQHRSLERLYSLMQDLTC
ncbi:cyclin-dependent kinase G-2-like isoform X2 [Hibiscus syriacus]|uniref:cyclin-dependent kinase G-2-like isoform X2 n=1 Tax=Hibiscus syriacus TaxID=106335 RepID=UPI001924EB8B|nr:cyclin-dependent kinase G-2-like isoform X2 [Hibiscus syriacus]